MPSADRSAAALATSSATWPTARESAGDSSQASDPTRPIRSSARRISGWKMTTRANRPTTARALQDRRQELQAEGDRQDVHDDEDADADDEAHGPRSRGSG